MFGIALNMPVHAGSHSNQKYGLKDQCRLMDPLKISLLILSKPKQIN